MKTRLSNAIAAIRSGRREQVPILSVIVVFHNMEREAPRTLHSLSTAYQSGINVSDYEVIVADCGSDRPLDAAMVEGHGSNFRLLRFEAVPSPVKSINQAVRMSTGKIVMICIDGARILTPGILSHTLAAFRAYRNPLVATLAFHLGPGLQNETMLQGYDRQEEDRLLASIGWPSNGYDLFRISTLAGSSKDGWIRPLQESNCLSLCRETFDAMGGMEERFRMPGGGLVNLDLYRTACDMTEELVLLLGEGSFHQIHGGVATNVPAERHPYQAFMEEYVSIRGTAYTPPEKSPTLFGQVAPQSIRFLADSFKGWTDGGDRHPAK